MRKLLFAALLSTTALWPAQAHAFFIPAFLGGLLTGIGLPGLGGALFGLGGSAFGAFSAGFGLGAFLTSGLGSLLLSIGLSALQYFLQPKAPKMDSARVNVRVPEPERWICGGRVRSGGAAIFGEYDDDGNFWYIVVHNDSRIMGNGPVAVILGEIEVDVDEDGWVTTAEFTKDQEEGGSPVFQIWTTTYTATDPIPPDPTPISSTPGLSIFREKFPEWTEDHLLVGTSYSIVRGRALSQKNRYKVYNWRGPIGIGEPSVSIVADWDAMYDPRDETQDIDDPSTWKKSSNAALVWAWWRTHPYGRNKPMSSVNWDKIAEQADICDEEVLDKNAIAHKRYECGIAVPDSKERGAAEQEILLTCDGVILHDEEGRAYVKVGHWEEPTLTLTKKRDILAMASREAQNGEMQTDGVIVRYTEPEFGWIAQPCAAWKNPAYYEEGRTPKYLTVDILGCHDHNQAVRLAKAIGETSQAPYRLLPTTGLRGLRARRERLIELDYDTRWNGPHKIATTVEVDEAGITTGFGIVPITENHWTLLEGEEGDRPAPIVSIEHDDDLDPPSGVVVQAVPIPGSNGNAVRIEATYDALSREDRRAEFQYKRESDLTWRPMVVLEEDLLAYSDVIDDGVTYQVQWRTVTTGGRASDWEPEPPYELSAVADPVAPAALSSFTASAAPRLGAVTFTIVTPNDSHIRYVSICRVAAGGVLDPDNDEIALLVVGPGSTFTYTNGDATRTNLIANGDFASSAGWSAGTGWSIGSGVATATAGTGSALFSSASITNGTTYRLGYTMTRTAGSLQPRLTAPADTFTSRSASGTYLESKVGQTGQTFLSFVKDAAFAGTLDNVVLFAETPACVPQGVWDYYAIPQNGSRVAGSSSSQTSIIII